MNTEQVGVLLVSTLNTSNNETVKTISNQNIGGLHECAKHYGCTIYCIIVFCCKQKLKAM